MKRTKKGGVLLTTLLSLVLLAGCAQTSSTTSPSSSTPSASSPSSVSSSSPSSPADSSEPAPDEPFVATLAFEGDAGVTGTFLVAGKEVETAEEGTTVNLRLTIAEGYVLDGEPVATGATLSKVAGVYAFTVGKENVTITAKTTALEKHALGIQADEGAHVQLTVKDQEAAEAVAGDQVLVHLTFDEKYSFTSIAVDGVELDTIEAGKTYSFVMPDAAVTVVVHAQYVPANYLVNNLVIVDSAHIHDVETTVAEGTSILEGSEVVFRFTGDAGLDYGVDIFKSGSTALTDAIEPAIEVQQVNPDDSTTYAVTFTMPTEDVDIYVYSSLASAEEGVTLTLPAEDHVRFYGLSSGEKYDAEEATLFLLPEDGYLLKKISYKADGGEAKTLAVTDGKVVLPLGEATETFEVFVEPVHTGVASITKAEGSKFSIEGKATNVTVGSEVRLTLRADSGFSLVSATTKTASGKDVDSAFDKDSGAITFTMPEEDVVISAETVSYFELSFDETAGVSNVHFTLSGLDRDVAITGATVGTTILVWFTVDETNYRLDHVRFGDTEIFADKMINQANGNYAYTYNVNAEDGGKVTFELTPKHGVTLAEGEDYSILSGPNARPAEGENVSFQIKPAVGKSIQSVSSDAVSIEEGDAAGWYHFTMPEQDVAIAVTTEDCATSTLSVEAPDVGSWSLKDAYGQDVTGQSEFNVGDVLTFSFTEKNGFVDYAVSATNAELAKEEAANTYSFTVGESPITLSVSATEEDSESIALADDLAAVASFSYTDNGLSGSKAYVGHTIEAKLNITAENTTFDAGAEATVTDATDVQTSIASDGLSATVTFTMPDAPVEIDLAFTTIQTVENTITVQWDLDNLSSDKQEYFKDNFFVQSDQFGNPAEIKIPWETVYESTKPVYFTIPNYYSIGGYSVVTVQNQKTGEIVTATDGTLLDHYMITNTFSCPHFLMPDAPVLIIVGFAPQS